MVNQNIIKIIITINYLQPGGSGPDGREGAAGIPGKDGIPGLPLNEQEWSNYS